MLCTAVADGALPTILPPMAMWSTRGQRLIAEVNVDAAGAFDGDAPPLPPAAITPALKSRASPASVVVAKCTSRACSPTSSSAIGSYSAHATATRRASPTAAWSHLALRSASSATAVTQSRTSSSGRSGDDMNVVL